MPLFEPTHQTKSTNPDTKNSSTETKTSNLITTLGSLLPFAPLLFEQFTGHKIPPMGGTMAEIQTALLQIQQNQQQLAQRLVSLETIATQQLTKLTNQFQSLRLTHEKKQIDFNPPSENQEY